MNVQKNGIMYSIVVPVYNSEQTLQILYERLVRVMEDLGEAFEIVFVEDCGRDNSWQVLQTLAKTDERVCAIQLLRNYGQANATMCGLRNSRGCFLITIDDDLQIPPEEIQALVEAMEQNPDMDVIIGAPRKKNHALWRAVGSDLLNWVNSHMFAKGQALKLTSFRIIRRSVVDHLLTLNTPRPAPGAILCTITPRIANVCVEHQPRAVGRGNYTLAKIMGLTLDRVLSFSTFPLRFLAIIGSLGITGSVLLGIFYTARYLLGGIGVAGWMTQILLLISLSGFNFFAFGIVGEYLLRILQSVQGTPQYLIRRKVGQLGPGSFRSPDFRHWSPQSTVPVTSGQNRTKPE